MVERAAAEFIVTYSVCEVVQRRVESESLLFLSFRLRQNISY